VPNPMEFWLFLPQMRLTLDQLVERARAAEAAGFAGVAGMDHLTPPLAESQPMFEGMITNTWLASQTETLRVGSLVLCDSFRHPAVLAREAVTLDHASGGRFELGIGWGSVADELGTFGVGSQEAKVRLGRLRESLEIMTALWTGEPLDYEGEHFSLHGAQQVPGPVGHIPIVIGGAGKGTMRLVAEHADWWNVHTHIVDKLEEHGLAQRGPHPDDGRRKRVSITPAGLAAHDLGVKAARPAMDALRARFGDADFATALPFLSALRAWLDENR